MSEFEDDENPPQKYTKRPREYRKAISPRGVVIDISAAEERLWAREGVPEGWRWVDMPKPRPPAPQRAPKVPKTIAHDPATGAKVLIRGGRLAVVDGAVVKLQNGKDGIKLPRGARWATPADAEGWSDPEVTRLHARRRKA